MNYVWIAIILVAIILLVWWLGRKEPREDVGRTAKTLPTAPVDNGLPEVEQVITPVEEPVSVLSPESAPEVVQAAAAEVPVAETPAIASPVVETPETRAPVEVVGVENPVEEVIQAEEPVKPDDLEIIEGIGPKIAGMLKNRGIITFAQVAATSVPDLQRIMLEENLRIADPTTWPEQSRLAAEGRWDELKTLQEGLKGGKRVA